MIHYNVKYGPRIDSKRCAATIHGNCAKLKKKTVLQYPDGTEITVDSIALLRGERADQSIEVLLNGAVNINENVLFLKE